MSPDTYLETSLAEYDATGAVNSGEKDPSPRSNLLWISIDKRCSYKVCKYSFRHFALKGKYHHPCVLFTLMHNVHKYIYNHIPQLFFFGHEIIEVIEIKLQAASAPRLVIIENALQEPQVAAVFLLTFLD